MTPQPARFLVQHQATADETFDIDYATNLSLAGLFIRTDKVLPAQSTLHVQFAPKRDSQLVSTFCRVKRVSAEGVDAEFVGLDAESLKLIESALS